MKKNKSNIFSNEIFLFPIGILFSLVFLLGDNVGAFSFLRKGISYISQPIYYSANTLSREISSYTKAIVELDEFKKNYEELSLKLYEKDVENSYYAMLLEENESLRKQISFGNKDTKYVLAKTLYDSSVDSLRVDQGRASGIEIGDVVTVGNVYIGIVSECDEKGSLIKLANSKNSSLEVTLVEGDWQNVTKSKDLGVLSKAVVTGSAEGIKIENISNSANIQNGSLVVVNDSRVGKNLVLGYLVDISTNPAEISRTGFVSPIVDYDKLITVFVNIGY
ncbi:rod shape-determining protein MreC [Candidatus Microgenomates bacterium]|jgi:rod shape-determining protein MreC|nr:rod shape-determining protein MreC [Candidatus Microgenomates bacterium]